MHARLVALAFALLATGPHLTPLAAQVQTGQRVRITLADDGRLAGGLAGLSSDELVLQMGVTTRTLARSSIARLEVSRGTRSRWKAGALVGAAVGAVGTFAVLNSGSSTSTNMCDSEHNQDAAGMGTCLAVAGVGGGLGGGLLGGLVGSLLHTERWEEVGMEGLRLTLLPVGSGGQVGLSASLATPF